MSTTASFRPSRARLAISFPLFVEAGDHPISGTPGFFQEAMEKDLPGSAAQGNQP